MIKMMIMMMMMLHFLNHSYCLLTSYDCDCGNDAKSSAFIFVPQHLLSSNFHQWMNGLKDNGESNELTFAGKFDNRTSRVEYTFTYESMWQKVRIHLDKNWLLKVER